MSEILIRPTGLDAALIERALSRLTGRSAQVTPRLVINADLAQRNPRFAHAARGSGVPLMIDPLTPYLQDCQHPADPWAALPFATASPIRPNGLSLTDVDALASSVAAHQITNGATRLIAPYFHISRRDDGWAQHQIATLRATREVLSTHGIPLPVTAVIDVNWSLLARRTWPDVLDPLLAAAQSAGCDEIALAGSRIDIGTRPADRLADLLAAIHHCATRTHSVIAWNQGLYGLACVAAGSLGYESGIGWHERADTPAWMRAHRKPPVAGPRITRPVYVDRLDRSIPRKTVEHLLAHRSISPDLPCPPGDCCPTGVAGLLNDSRLHTLTARSRSLHELAIIDPRFRWTHLVNRAASALDLATRIDVLAAREGFHKLTSAPYDALRTVAAAQAKRDVRRAADRPEPTQPQAGRSTFTRVQQESRWQARCLCQACRFTRVQPRRTRSPKDGRYELTPGLQIGRSARPEQHQTSDENQEQDGEQRVAEHSAHQSRPS